MERVGNRSTSRGGIVHWFRIWRAAVVRRAYYAAYSLLTHRLEPAKIAYADGWRNPAHADLPRYVARIPGLGAASKKAVRRALRRLRQRREDADYRPRVTIDRLAARQSLSDAAEVFRILGAANEP